MGRILGLDVGDKTIGVAVSDLLGLTAQGITTIKRVSLDRDLERLLEIIEEYDVESVSYTHLDVYKRQILTTRCKT